MVSESPPGIDGIVRNSITIHFAVWLALIFLAAPSDGWTSEYLVAPGDRLKVTVVQWPEYSGESQVDDSGHFTVPSTGRIKAEGRNVAEIQELVRNSVSALTDAPGLKVVVEVVEFRPISVLGHVNSPGRYPYAANTTVLDAIAMAGGFLRIAGDNLRNDLQISRIRERVGVLRLERLAALARRARLLAEQENLEAIEFPTELFEQQKEPVVRSAMDQEARLFALRKNSIKEDATLNPNQIKIYKDEIFALGRHAKAVDGIISFLEAELKKQNELLGRGLARTAQVVTLQGEVLDMKAERRRTILDSTRAKLRINEVNYNSFLLGNERQIEIANSLAAVETQLAILEEQIDTQVGLLGLQETSMGEETADSEGFLPYTYSILRKSGTESNIARALETTRIVPGDIVIVQMKQ